VAAASVLALITLRHGRHEQPVAVAPPAISVTLKRGDSSSASALVSGDRLVVPENAHADMLLPTGTTIDAASGTDVLVSSLGSTQSFALASGSAQFHVAKLVSGERFLVHTSDAEVEVRGTIFRVSVIPADPACGNARTRVDVVEGVVDVRHDGRLEALHAGAHWPLCAATAPSPSAPSPSSEASSAPPQAVTTAVPTPSSSLAAQNELFASGIEAKRRGDKAAAIAAFDRYLARYPSGFLAESAMVERMRVSTGEARSAAAKAYLARYPQGFARTEAKAIVDAAG
jgi:hypothetical protein